MTAAKPSDRTQLQPFRLHVPDEAIADLRDRLSRTRFPDQAPGPAWAYGADLAYMQELVEYCRTGSREANSRSTVSAD